MNKGRKKVFENTDIGFKRLRSWIHKNDIENLHICMESTDCYSEGCAEFFHKLGFKVSIINLLQIKTFRKTLLVRQKTDSTDAQLIAEFCRIHNPAPWRPRSPDEKELHEINKRIDSLKIELNRVMNCLEKKNLSKLILESINSEITFINKQIAKLEEEVQKIIGNNSDLSRDFQRLTALKEVGEKTALAVLVDMPNVSNFQKSG